MSAEYKAHIDALEELVEQQRQVIEQYRIALNETDALPPVFGLTGSHRKILNLLWRRPGLVRRHQIYAALYADCVVDPPDPQIIRVFIHGLRKKLQPYGVSVKTHGMQGYELPPCARETIRSFITGAV